MLAKTHLAIGAFLIVFLLPQITYKLVFIPIVLVASLLPDIDTGFSTFGKRWYFRPVQWLTKHRGMIHSFTVCLGITILLVLSWPVAALPFFLGYSFHLLVDSFTDEGIRPFWPLKAVSHGLIRTGSKIEDTLFIVFIILDIVFFVNWFV